MTANVIDLPSRSPARPAIINTGVLPCQQQDPALWFSNSIVELNLAKAFCRGCHQRQACLAGALQRAEAAGVWGGEIFEHGQIIENKRPRGRPRKTTLEPRHG
jgi:WhiB family redox-sensing transcriptional regulator